MGLSAVRERKSSRRAARGTVLSEVQGPGVRGQGSGRKLDFFPRQCLRLFSSPIPDPRSPTPSSGFTLLEVLVAMAVLAVALVSLLGLYNRSLLLTIRAQRLSTATLLVQEMLTRTQLEGMNALRVTTGDFADLHPGQYPEFRWYRTVRPTALAGLWELRVGVSWGEREDETCELTLFTPLT